MKQLDNGLAARSLQAQSLNVAVAQQAKIFPSHRRASERGDLRNVVSRTYFDEVHPDELQAAQTPDDRVRLPTCQPADFRRAGTRREGVIERIDIEAEVNGSLADHLADLSRDRGGTALMHVLRGDHRDALSERPVMHRTLHRRTDADLNHPPRLYQSFQDGMIENRAVGEGLPEGVEMDQSERTLSLCQSAEKRQRDAVVATERDEVLDPTGLLLDVRQAFRDVTQRNRKVANIG